MIMKTRTQKGRRALPYEAYLSTTLSGTLQTFYTHIN